MANHIIFTILTNIRPHTILGMRFQSQSDASVAGASAVGLTAVAVGKKSRCLLEAVLYFAMGACSVKDEGLTHVEREYRSMKGGRWNI